MEKVSVIMPVYNSERYLDEAIGSVLAQTYTEWELWVVDDCSTDRSAEIAAGYAARDARVRVLSTGTSSGNPGVPRNLGIEAATGRFIAFLDSDDAWLPNKLADQVPLFEDAKTAIVYADYEKVDEQGARANRIFHAPKKVDYKYLLRGNVIGNLTGMFDTRKTGKRFLRPVHHEDYVLWLSILKEGFVGRSAGTVCGLYRVREQSVSSRKFMILSWQWRIYRDMENLSLLKSVYYYACYAYNAFCKSLI